MRAHWQAPPAAAATLFAAIPGAAKFGEQYYQFPCNSTATVAFNFAGVEAVQWPVASSFLSQGLTAAGSDMCVSTIVGLDLGRECTGAWGR